MKLHEVLTHPEVLSGDKWFRPVGWPKGWAFTIKGGSVYSVPSPRGGSFGITADVATLAGEWEVISVDEVLE